MNLYGYHNHTITGNRDIHKGLRINKGGNRKGHTPIIKPETIEKRFYLKYEKIVEEMNNTRDIRLFKLRFEITFNRTDISRQRKWVVAHRIAKEYGVDTQF